MIAPASYCLSPEKQCQSQSSTLRRPLHLGTLSPTLNLLHGSPRAFQSLSFQRLHTPQTPVNSLLSTFRSGPTRKLCSSDVSSAQNDVRASALRAFPVCAHLHVNPSRTLKFTARWKGDALRTFPVCAHQHVICVPPHDSEVHRIKEGQRYADRAAWRGSLQRARAGEVRNGGAWRIGSEMDAGAREWGGQHPVAAHLIPLRPTCHFKC